PCGSASAAPASSSDRGSSWLSFAGLIGGQLRIEGRRGVAADIAYRLDAGTGKRVEHRAHQRVRRGLVAERLVSRRRLLPERGLALVLGNADHPALAGPITQKLAQAVG